MPLRPQTLHELPDMCLGGLLTPLTKLRGVGSFFKLTIYPAYSKTIFLAEAALVKFRTHGNLVALETKCWMAMNLATKWGGGHIPAGFRT